MIPTTVFTYATALFSLFAAVNAQVQEHSYTNFQEFIDDLPDCNKNCMEVDTNAILLTCGETDAECACSQTLRLEDNTSSNRSQACIEACPASEDADMAVIAQNILSTCLPFMIADPAAFNTTTEQLVALGLVEPTNGTNSTTPTNPSNVSTTGSGSVAIQTDNAAGSLLASSFLIAAVPAVLSFLV